MPPFQLDPAFTQAVYQLAKIKVTLPWSVSRKSAPTTYQGLAGLIKRNGRFFVSDEFSDNTIYGEVSANVAFRAWHDYTHHKLEAEFNLAGEYLVCRQMQQDIIDHYGITEQTLRWCNYLYIEIIGQFLYKERHKTFPTNQLEFAYNWLDRGEMYALRTKT